MNLSRIHAIAGAAACCLMTSPAALAAAATSKATGENTPLNLDHKPAVQHAAATGGGLVQMIVGLAVVLGVIFGLHWVLKQVKSSREGRSAGQGLKIVATLAVGPGRSVHLIRAGRELVLVGSAEHGVTPIRVYSEDEALQLGLTGSDFEDEDPTGHGGDTGAGGPIAAKRTPPTVAGWLAPYLRQLQRMTVRG